VIYKTVDEFLAHLDLGEYSDLFEENDIDIKGLARITDRDLQGIGVDSLGHRRKILDAVPGEPGEPGASPLMSPSRPSPGGPPSAPAEKVFLDSMFDGIDGEHTVRITSHRAILGSKSYVIDNIAAVEAYSNQDQVDLINEGIEAKNSKTRSRKVWLTFMAGFLMFVGLLMMIDEGEVAGALMCCGTPAIGLIIKAKGMELLPLQSAHWCVRITAAGTVVDTLCSLQASSVEEVLHALNDAIAHQNS